MTTKKKLGLLMMAFLIAACINVHGQFTLNVRNGDDDVQTTSPPVGLNLGPRPKSLPPINAIPMGSNGVVLASLVSSGSTNLQQSRVFAMAGLSGVNVPTERMIYPPAWYCIPVMGSNSMSGLQWFDMLVTSNKSWMGTEFLTNQAVAWENGHRIAFHCGGNDLVNQYEGEVVVNLTNANLNTRFGIHTNTAGGEILFNANFVGINFGENGVLDSYYDPSLGRWVKGGDDTVYDNGQAPSTVTYHAWHRFGATIAVNVDGSTGFLNQRRQFAQALRFVTVNLYRSGNQVATRTVYAAQIKLHIARNPPATVRVWFEGGQWNAPYKLQWRSAFSPATPWQNFGQTYYSGGALDIATTEDQEFYRAVAADE